MNGLTVYENIETPLLYRGIKSSERKSLVAEVLDRFNIVAKKDLFPSQLSGGQQQLVGVARAVIGKPKLLLADEPTGNIDWDMAQRLLLLLVELNKMGKTILLATHDMSLIRAAKTQVQARVLRIQAKQVWLAGADL